MTRYCEGRSPLYPLFAQRATSSNAADLLGHWTTGFFSNSHGLTHFSFHPNFFALCRHVWCLCSHSLQTSYIAVTIPVLFMHSFLSHKCTPIITQQKHNDAGFPAMQLVLNQLTANFLICTQPTLIPVNCTSDDASQPSRCCFVWAPWNALTAFSRLDTCRPTDSF